MRSRHIAAALALVSGLAASAAWTPAQGLDGRERRGATIARTACAGCHAVGRQGASPLREAPPFRDLHRRYPVTDLAEALTEGIRTGHPTMPEFRFDPDEADNLIAYLQSLER